MSRDDCSIDSTFFDEIAALADDLKIPKPNKWSLLKAYRCLSSQYTSNTINDATDRADQTMQSPISNNTRTVQQTIDYKQPMTIPDRYKKEKFEMGRRKLSRKEESPDPLSEESEEELSSEQSDQLSAGYDPDDHGDTSERRKSTRKRRPPKPVTTFTGPPTPRARKMVSQLEVDNATRVAVQLLRDPLLLATNPGIFSSDMPLGMLPGLIRKSINNGQSGRKRKLSDDEKVLLAKLYQDHFTIYHSKRYFDPDYRIDIADYGNLKYWLLDDWAKKLSALGFAERSAVDIANRVHEMVMDVVDYRTQQESYGDNANATVRAAGCEMSLTFPVFNKVYDFINIEHPEIEELIDRYEFTLGQMLEEKNLQLVLSRKRSEISGVEATLICELLETSKEIYDRPMIKKSGLSEQEGILSGWVLHLQQAGFRRFPDEIRAFIYTKRKLLTELMEQDHETQNNRGKIILRTQKRDLSPNLEAINRALGPFTLKEISREELFKKIGQIQNSMMGRNMKVEIDDEHVPHEQTAESGRAESYEKDNREDLDVPMDDYHHSIIPSTAHLRSSNRPQMSRAEKRLLAMLYRQNYIDYEKYNYCRTVKKSLGNRKWILLDEWADRLTSLGVTQREPQELATKIIQYKKTVSQHREAKEKGINNLKFSNRWAKMKCARPLTPTTKFFDVNDETMNPNTYSEQAIADYVEEAQQTRQLYVNRFGLGGAVDPMEEADFENNVIGRVQNEQEMVHEPIEQEEEVDIKPNLAALQVPLTTAETDSKPVRIQNLANQLHPEMTLRDALACVEAQATNGTNQREEEDVDMKPSTLPLNLQSLFKRVSNDVSNTERNGAGEPDGIHAMVYDDLVNMEDKPVLLYDSVDTSGHMQRYAITKTIEDRDVNYLLWSKSCNGCITGNLQQDLEENSDNVLKSIVLELDMPVSQYVCYMCEQMANTAHATAIGQRRALGMTSTQNSYLLSQQPLPTISVTGDGRLVPMQWVKTGPPRHRCVSFLKPTICEKLVNISHMLMKAEEPYMR